MNIINHQSAPLLGLTAKERAKYSILGYARAVARRDTVALGDYAAISRDVAKRTGQADESGFLVPAELLGTRAMTTTTGSAGGYAVGTSIVDHVAPQSRASLLDALPLTKHSDLDGTGVIVSEATQATASWFIEGGATTTPTEATLGSASLAQRSVFAWVPVSGQLVRQAGDAGRRFVDRGLAQALDQAQGQALAQGAGAVEPLGILPNGSGSAGLPGVDTRAGTSFALSDACAMLKVAEAYASDDTVMWLAGLTAAEKLRQRVKTATYGNGFLLGDDGLMLGRRVVVSRLAPTSGLIVAPWSSVHFGAWGAPLVKVDTSTYFNSGGLRIGIMVMCDMAYEAPGQIAVATALT